MRPTVEQRIHLINTEPVHSPAPKPIKGYRPKEGERVRHSERGYMGKVIALWGRHADVQWDGFTGIFPCDYDRMQPEHAPVVERKPNPPKVQVQRERRARIARTRVKLQREPKIATPRRKMEPVELPPKSCEICGTEFSRNRYPSGDMEGIKQFERRRFCSRDCREEWVRRTLGKEFLLKPCPTCGITIPRRKYGTKPEQQSLYDKRKTCDGCLVRSRQAWNRISQEREDRVRQDIRAGMKREDVARKHRMSSTTITRIKKTLDAAPKVSEATA